MKAFGHVFDNKPLPLHYYLGLDARTNPLDEVAVDGFTFYEACARGAHDVAMVFLLSGFDINATEVNSANAYGYTGLHYAATAGDLALVSVLLDQGARADATSANGGVTPLMLALAGGHVEVVRALIQHGAEPRRTDAQGEPAIFYGAKHPVALHVVKTMLNLDFATLKNASGETLLFGAARGADGRNSVLYLIEMGGVDVNAKSDATGETALHHAARANHEDIIKALMSKGANPSAASNNGTTPLTMRGCKHTALMMKCAREGNKTVLARMTRPDASNLANITLSQMQHFLVAFIAPNLFLYMGSFLPTWIGVFVTFTSAVGFAVVANFAMRQKNRSLATAGWFSGALTFGSYVLVSRVFPVFEAHDAAGSALTSLWWIVTVLMYACYARAVLADPGAVHSSPEMREAIIEAVARDGQAAVKREHFDMTTLVRKPLRSKHCSKTHFTVSRFDHYCVWTGNAIGGGNHRPFVLYCVLQTISQTIVAYTTLTTLFSYLPQIRKYDFDGVGSVMSWFFTPENTLITYFLVFYNSFVFLFVSAIVLTQVWYAMRNVTSNEVWYSDRYSWMFVLGKRAYSMYDQGPWKNLVDFFWSGNLCAEHYTVPKMNDYLTTLTRQYAAKMKSQQAGRFAGGAAAGGPHAAVPSAIVTSGANGSPLASDDGSAWSQAEVGSPVDAPPQTPAEALSEMQMLLPQDKRTEMECLQAMLQQMINGAAEPVAPESVTDPETRAMYARKAKTMYRHYQMAMRAAGTVSAAERATTA